MEPLRRWRVGATGGMPPAPRGVWPLLLAGGAAAGWLVTQCEAERAQGPETAATSWLHRAQPGTAAVAVAPGQVSPQASAVPPVQAAGR